MKAERNGAKKQVLLESRGKNKYYLRSGGRLRGELPEQGAFEVMTEHDLEQIRGLLRDALAPMQADLAAVKTDVAAQGGALAAVRAEMAAQGAELTAVRADVGAIKTEIDGWPDLHFLQAMAQQQIREAAEAREARRYMEIKLDEIYSSMATSSEIKRLRDEVSTSLDRERLLDLRISAIEMRLGIRNPLAPTE